ncbi:protein PML-like [Saccostrea cucullata]|uniref:protein PML-like n=1 Tax=Saccostrea cuccullata TaxID=36930 RepID=UPI002ED6B28A
MAESKNETPVDYPESDQCHCPICLEKVRNPKYLPCYHTFCEACIQTYISSTATRKDNETVKSIECPVCRRCIEAPRNDISSEDWTSELPQNKLILTLSIDPEQDDNKNCMFCKRLEKTVLAYHWCKSCMEAICEDCKSLHRAVPSLQNHKIVNLSNIKEVNSEIEIEESCLLHKGKVLDVFCHDHQKLCCSVCLVKEHKLCKNIDTVEDIALEIDRDSIQKTASKYTDLEKTVNDILSENQNKVSKLHTRKQEICLVTEEKVQEIKSLFDNAHVMWLKRFEQNHADSVGNIEIASEELRRFSTTIHEARTMLQSVLKNGSSKQLFVTNYKLQNQISDHITRLKSLDVWNFPEDYKQHNSDFLSQISNAKEFEDVVLSKLQSTALERILLDAPDNDAIVKRRKTMSQNDWMNVDLRKLSQIKLPERAYYGLFIHDTKILLSFTNQPSLKIYDISASKGECIHTEKCQNAPHDLCHSDLSLNEIYVSFEHFINHYRIDVAESISFTKLRTIQLKEPVLAIARGPTAVFAANNTKRMICSLDFHIIHSSSYNKIGNAPFVSSSLISDRYGFVENGIAVAIDQNNKEIFKSSQNSDFRGLSFDLQDNILVCNWSSKLKQFKQGGGESRDIDVTDMAKTYNVVLHPAGEKILVLDFDKICCVYQVS